jgi:hypothetical protein
LSYTTVGMPLALAAWHLLVSPPRRWHTAAVVALTVAAVGFKEQGLAIVALVVAAWVTRAPSATRTQAVILVVLALAYVALRFAWHPRMATFEQAIGLGFREVSTSEATARFGTFPYLVYAYSGLATIGNVLFSEPSAGVFSIVRAIGDGTAEWWQYIHLAASIGLTTLLAWWATGELVHARRSGWTDEARTVVALVLVLAACGALSFNYSRDRLGGMAVPFYALAAFHALRAAARRVTELPRWRFEAAAAGLVLLASLWHIRAVGTVEAVRVTAARNQMEWLTSLAQRTRDFADRPVYLSILDSLRAQGTAESAPLPPTTRGRSWACSARPTSRHHDRRASALRRRLAARAGRARRRPGAGPRGRTCRAAPFAVVRAAESLYSRPMRSRSMTSRAPTRCCARRAGTRTS